MKQVDIEDNFLDQKEFDKFQDLMMGRHIHWAFGDGIVAYDDTGDKHFQFVHMFYGHDIPQSQTFEIMIPLLAKIEPWLSKFHDTQTNSLSSYKETYLKNAKDLYLTHGKIIQGTLRKHISHVEEEINVLGDKESISKDKLYKLKQRLEQLKRSSSDYKVKYQDKILGLDKNFLLLKERLNLS